MQGRFDGVLYSVLCGMYFHRHGSPKSLLKFIEVLRKEINVFFKATQNMYFWFLHGIKQSISTEIQLMRYKLFLIFLVLFLLISKTEFFNIFFIIWNGIFCEKILIMENSKQTFIQILDYNDMGNFNFSENQC